MVRAEAADSGGQQNDLVLRGDDEVVRGRRKESVANSRVRAAMQAALDKLRPKTVPAAVSAEMLQKERESVAARGRIVPKTAGKIATDEHTWEIYVTEQGLQIDEYPKVEQTVQTHRIDTICHRERTVRRKRSKPFSNTQARLSPRAESPRFCAAVWCEAIFRVAQAACKHGKQLNRTHGSLPIHSAR